jgi:hypothetical protein
MRCWGSKDNQKHEETSSRGDMMKSEVWGGRANGFSVEAIKEVSGVMKSFDPKTRR